jgi:hypothetical protein
MWESVEKGSPLWLERQALYWKFEIERMFNPFDTRWDLSLERADIRREWMLRYPRSE